MKKCHVVGAGDFTPSLLQKEKDDLLIAADLGYRYLSQMGLTPDFFVGDGDSLGEIPEDVPRVVLPCEKDDTDILSALRLGLEKGYTHFCIYGALGGKRLSHTIANIQTLSFLQEKGAEGTLYDENYTVSLLPPGAYRFSFVSGYFSLFAMEEGTVSIQGAKFPLEMEVLKPSFPKGVSNEGTENTLITVHSGKILLVREK